jgi:hypothetical protein
LPLEIAQSVVGDEKGANRAIGIVGAEVSALHIEAGKASAGALQFQNVPAGARVAKLLRKAEVLILCNGSKLGPVFFVVFGQKMLGAEAGT